MAYKPTTAESKYPNLYKEGKGPLGTRMNLAPAQSERFDKKATQIANDNEIVPGATRETLKTHFNPNATEGGN